jgi:hypothetical protein
MLLGTPARCWVSVSSGWSPLLTDYKTFRGRLLIVVWIATLFSPLICGKMLHSF